MRTSISPFFDGGISGRIIYAVTKSRAIKALTFRLGANTAGVGVRFRSLDSWRQIIHEGGLQVTDQEVNPHWGKTFAARHKLPLLCRERYQLFVSCIKMSQGTA